jgi:Holliday junction resolvase RusA-like endonuclease
VKPDGDNLAKAALDGLKGIAWADDSQVCRLLVEKRYSMDPRVEIVIAGVGAA